MPGPIPNGTRAPATSIRLVRRLSPLKWLRAALFTSLVYGHRKTLFHPIFSLRSVQNAGCDSKQGERYPATSEIGRILPPDLSVSAFGDFLILIALVVP